MVRLTDDQREALGRLLRTGSHPAAMRRRAAILRRADADGPDAWTDEDIADHLGTSRMTVMRVRQQFANEGLDATLHRKKPTGRTASWTASRRRGSSPWPARSPPTATPGGP